MKFTVITVTYNSASTLRDTMESVLAQSFVELEYIIVDGASKDETVELIREYEPRFEGRLRWISESDKGLYDAMNKGIGMATGDIIGLLNSDDFYTDNSVLYRVAMAFQQSPHLDAVYGDIHYVNSDDLQKCVRYYSSKLFRRTWMRMGFMPAHPSFYMRRSRYEELGLYKTDYNICADFELLLRYIFVNHIKVKYLAADFVTMRTGGASTDGLSVHKMIMREHLRACSENGIFTNRLILSLRYLYKIVEVAISQWKR